MEKQYFHSAPLQTSRGCVIFEKIYLLIKILHIQRLITWVSSWAISGLCVINTSILEDVSTLRSFFTCDSLFRCLITSALPWCLHSNSCRHTEHQKWNGVVPAVMNGHVFVHSGLNFALYVNAPAFLLFFFTRWLALSLTLCLWDLWRKDTIYCVVLFASKPWTKQIWTP